MNVKVVSGVVALSILVVGVGLVLSLRKQPQHVAEESDLQTVGVVEREGVTSSAIEPQSDAQEESKEEQVPVEVVEAVPKPEKNELNPIREEVADVNVFESATNPFEGGYTNPFK